MSEIGEETRQPNEAPNDQGKKAASHKDTRNRPTHRPINNTGLENETRHRYTDRPTNKASLPSDTKSPSHTKYQRMRSETRRRPTPGKPNDTRPRPTRRPKNDPGSPSKPKDTRPRPTHRPKNDPGSPSLTIQGLVPHNPMNGPIEATESTYTNLVTIRLSYSELR